MHCRSPVVEWLWEVTYNWEDMSSNPFTRCRLGVFLIFAVLKLCHLIRPTINVKGPRMVVILITFVSLVCRRKWEFNNSTKPPYAIIVGVVATVWSAQSSPPWLFASRFTSPAPLLFLRQINSIYFCVNLFDRSIVIRFKVTSNRRFQHRKVSEIDDQFGSLMAGCRIAIPRHMCTKQCDQIGRFIGLWATF